MSEIIRIADICRNFPSAPLQEIDRESQLDAIENALTSSAQVVFIDGEEGIGKTTVLAQFMKRHEGNVIGLFITPLGRLSYSDDYINTVIVEQLYWMFEGKRYEHESATSKDVQKLMLRLQKLAKTKQIFFVVDGLDGINVSERDEVVAYLFREVLQIGLREFRYLIAGNPDTVKLPGSGRVRHQIQQVYPFDRDQIRKYFSEFNPTEQDINDLKSFSHGVPFRLEVARRWLEDGQSVEDLFRHNESKLVDLFDIDWARIDLSAEQNKLALAIVTFGGRPIAIQQIARLCQTDESELKTFLTSTLLIDIESPNNTVRFRTEAQRNFSATKLFSLHDQVRSLLLDDMMARPEDNDSLVYLIDDLSNAGRTDVILHRLCNDHFANVFAKEQSFSVLKRHASIGCRAAHKEDQNVTLFQFGTVHTLLVQLDGAIASRAEVRALLKIGKHEEAITLACSAETKEARFALLATIGNHLASEKINFPLELKENILVAAQSIDFTSLGDTAAVIAKDLVAFDPDLAFRIMTEKSSKAKHQSERDLNFANFNIAVTGSGLGASVKELVHKRTKEQISDTKIQDFADVVATLYMKYDAEQVISRVNRLDPVNRMYFLTPWLQQNAKSAHAADVADYALAGVISHSSYTPKLSDFRVIASVLPYMADRERANELAKSLESQKSIVPSHGTTEEYIRLQMLLLQSEAVDSIDKARDRAINVYAEVDDLSDVSTKTACLAWILHHMHDFKNLSQIDDGLGVLGSVADQLIATFNTLLLSTADHYEIAKRPIDALAKYYPEKAFEIAGKLNTEERRNKAYKRLVFAQIRTRAYREDCTFLHKSVMKITTPLLRDHTIVDILDLLRKDIEFNPDVPYAKAVLSLWNLVKSPEARFLALLNSYFAVKGKNDAFADAMKVEERLDPLWQASHNGWYKSYIAYVAVDVAAQADKPLAEKWLLCAREESKRSVAASEELNTLITTLISMAVRSITPIAKLKAVNEYHWDRLCKLISTLPEGAGQIHVWADLAVRMWLKGDTERCHQVVSKFIKPIIDSVPTEFSTLCSYLIGEAASALYLDHPNSAEEYIEKLSLEQQDSARGQICYSLLSGLSPAEPGPEQPGIEFEMTYDRAIDICSVLSKIKKDSTLFSLIGIMCDSLASRKNRTSMTNGQKKSVLDRLSNIVEKQLPDLRNIQHDGFKIASSAKILKARTQIETVPAKAWEKLREDADKIPNIADKAIVICVVAVQAASFISGRAKSWLIDARALANGIPSKYDKIDRYSWMAEMVGKIDPSFSQSVVREAFELATSLKESDLVEERQRRLLDLAHQYDAKLVEDLIEIVDRDPARKEAKKRLNSHAKVLKARKKVFEHESSEFDQLKDDELQEIASKNLNSLLYDRFTTRHMSEMVPMLRRTESMGLKDALPVLTWFIENSCRRFENVSQKANVIIEMFEATLQTAELATVLISKSKSFSHRSGASTTLFRDGEREAAHAYLKTWFLDYLTQDLIISDPYFGPDELEFVKLAQEVNPHAHIRLLLGLEHIKKYQKDGKSLEDIFREKWDEISDEDPPRTDITIVGIKPSTKHPIHDRWIISGDNGIRVGTSVNSLGIGRTSEMSSLLLDEVKERKTEVMSYINRDVRERVSYQVIDL